MKRICSLLLAVTALALLLSPALSGAARAEEAAVEDTYSAGLSAADCGVASLTHSDLVAVVGEDVIFHTLPDGSTYVQINFHCGEPLYVTQTDGTILYGEAAQDYLDRYEEYISYAPLNDEQWPVTLPEPGSSQQFVCAACSDLRVIFTVYFVAPGEETDELTLEEHTAYPPVRMPDVTLPTGASGEDELPIISLPVKPDPTTESTSAPTTTASTTASTTATGTTAATTTAATTGGSPEAAPDTGADLAPAAFALAAGLCGAIFIGGKLLKKYLKS